MESKARKSKETILLCRACQSIEGMVHLFAKGTGIARNILYNYENGVYMKVATNLGI